jgi:LemA protein
MKTNWKLIAGAGVLVVLLLVFYYSINNDLVRLHEGIDGAWAQVETVLQRRYDLVPNLVSTVKGYAAHEREVLEEVTRARSQWAAAGSVGAKVEAAGALESALARLMVVVENYPDLKANQSFLALQDELAGTENRIAVERRRYNEAVQQYNTRVRSFPASLVARIAGFARSDAYFRADDTAREAPRVQF